MSPRKKYSQAVKNYNYSLRKGLWRRVSYWEHECDRQAERVKRRIEASIMKSANNEAERRAQGKDSNE